MVSHTTSHRRHLAAVALLFLIRAFSSPVCPAASQPRHGPDPPHEKSLEARLLADAADGRLDQHSLLQAALIAGGVADDMALAGYRRKFTAHCQSLGLQQVSGNDLAERAESLFDHLHQRILQGRYELACNAVHRSLDKGHFNCVTATVLYQSLCDRFDVPAHVVGSRRHVRIRVLAGQGRTVETTCPDWFAHTDRAAIAAYARSTGALSLGGTEPWRELSHVQLVAKVYYNRGVELFRRGEYKQAHRVTEISWRLDPQHQEARDNVLATMNNWMLVLCDQGRFQEAAQLLAAGRRFDPDYAPLAINAAYLWQSWKRVGAAQPGWPDKEFDKVRISN